MNKKIKVNGSTITLTDKNYLAAGGEGEVYVNSNVAYKLYHDKNKMIPLNKIKELSSITNSHVVIPKHVIYDTSDGSPIGYSTDFIVNSHPLLKFFTKTFKQDNNISHQMVCDLVKQMQLVTNDIHKEKCLIVDYNELNVLVKIEPNLLTPYYIDSDSYATPSFKATAVMDSIRDRKCSSVDKNGKLQYNPNIESDWFSFAILSFWIYTNVHAFRGGHSNYKPKDKQKQMDDGISVFHTGVRVPPSVTPFNTIPKRHLDWFQDVFLRNGRSVPPLPDSMAPLQVPSTIILVKGNNKIDVIDVASYSEDIVTVSQFLGINYVVTKKHIYADQNSRGDTESRKCLVVPAADGTMVVAVRAGSKITFKELNTGREIGTLASPDVFSRNNCIYTLTNGKLVENGFSTINSKVIQRITEVENVSNYSATVHEGCVIQDLLGKKFLTLPYKKGACFSKHIPQLDKYRIVEAKSEKTVTVILAESKGQYDRFVIVFKKDYSDFDIRKVDDVAYDTINFCVMDNGLCALLASPTELELFVNNSKVEVLNDPPIDSTMKMFTTTDGIFFVNGNTIHQLKRK